MSFYYIIICKVRLQKARCQLSCSSQLICFLNLILKNLSLGCRHVGTFRKYISCIIYWHVHCCPQYSSTIGMFTAVPNIQLLLACSLLSQIFSYHWHYHCCFQHSATIGIFIAASNIQLLLACSLLPPTLSYYWHVHCCFQQSVTIGIFTAVPKI